MAELRVLNFNQNPEISCENLAENGEDISKRLQKLMLQIKGQFMCDDGKSIDYNGIQTSEIFSQYVKECTSLIHLDLATLTEQQKMAFFINIYNALTIHGICEQGVPSSVLGVKNFWKSIAYNIGSHVFTLDDIEHGILRGNRPHPSSPNPLFNDNDPRLQYSVKNVDPRIHFALVCGAKGIQSLGLGKIMWYQEKVSTQVERVLRTYLSCPAINVYSTTNLERGLEAATENFCSQEVHIDLNANQVTLSKIFLWFKSDFAENDIDLLRWIQAHVSGELSFDLQKLIKDHDSDGIKIAYSDYNWNLNNIAPAKI